MSTSNDETAGCPGTASDTAPRSLLRTRLADARAGLTLGVESVPDGLASGLLAAVNPAFGLYAALVGTAAGAIATSSVFMSVQTTGAMSVLLAEVPQLHQGDGGTQALFTLSATTIALILALERTRIGGFGLALPSSPRRRSPGPSDWTPWTRWTMSRGFPALSPTCPCRILPS